MTTWGARFVALLLALVLALVAACDPQLTDTGGDGDEAVAARSDAIFDSGDGQVFVDPHHPAIFPLSGCGATLIASNVAITAAHCVDRNDMFDDDVADRAGLDLSRPRKQRQGRTRRTALSRPGGRC